ncbi:MAG: PIG-L deacetylase family protein [Armatimonadota bacterium]
MKLTNPNSDIYIPDGAPCDPAMVRTTHMGIGAHQDDLEILAYPGILECFEKPNKWFTGVVVTDGAGSARSGPYASYTDEQMKAVRRIEQRKAAFVGEYSIQFQLDYSSADIKNPSCTTAVDDIKQIIAACKPSVIYTHNLADKHDTHVSVVLRVIQAIRELSADDRPTELYGCEAWRGLDWLNDEDKVLQDCFGKENLAVALIGVFDSQVSGGKRYDLASVARRRANATYLASHATDTATELSFAVDLSPLITDVEIDPGEYIAAYVARFASDVADRISRLR